MKNLHQRMDKTASQPKLNRLIPQSKDTAKTQWHVTSRPVSHARIHKDSKQRDGERFTNQMESKNNK